ncbi:MAG: hypothetical protein MR888_04590, partial [Clostridiales bacterium]|nr:hypothetical protein [Clostridiales bacterium]
MSAVQFVIPAFLIQEDGNSQDTIHWTNTNLMLDPESDWYNPYVTGMKTGSLSGHYCLIATLEKDGKT